MDADNKWEIMTDKLFRLQAFLRAGYTKKVHDILQNSKSQSQLFEE